MVLNKKSKPVIRALKTELTNNINEKGVMDMSAMMNIKDLYFGGDMEAAPALSGQSSGLINEIKPVKQIIDEIIDEKYPNDNNVLTNAPHSLDDIVDWNHPYSIEKALYPLESLRNKKHFPKRSRINDIWGDRNLKVKLD